VAFRFAFLVLLCAWLAGCRLPGALPFGAGAAPNPIPVVARNDDALWERTIDVLHSFQFPVAREDRLARIIETEYKVGSGCLEPWQRDSVDVTNRLESTLQSVRRMVRITLAPVDGGGGYAVSVEAFKEREDLPGLAANSPGAATFQESTPLQFDLNPVVGQTAPSGWVSVGRDIALEQAILASLRAAYAG
jgi:hypothetical protein